MKLRKEIVVAVILMMIIMTINSSIARAASAMINMLNLTGARQVGMGETAPLFEPDPFSLEYNPATIIGITRGRVGFSHNSFFQDRNTNSLAAIFPIKGLDFGVHARLASVGDIEVRGDFPTSEPDYIATSEEFAVKVFVAERIMPRLQIGVSTGWLMETIDINRASILAFGIGAIYYSKYDLAFHASAMNLGGKVKFVKQEDDPPVIFRSGIGYHKYDISATLDYVNVKSGDSHIHVGGEYLIRDQLFLRAGYQTGYDNRNFSAGAGFLYRNFRVDYAFVPYQSDLGNSHRFTLTYAIR